MSRLFVGVFALFAITAFACTSWVIAPDSSETGTYVVHKNRDWGKGKEIEVKLYFSQIKSAKYKVLAFSPYMLFNEKGLGIIDTSVPITVDGPHNPQLTIGAVFNMVAHNCATVQEAIDMLEKLVNEGQKPKHNHFTMCDGKEVAVIEMTPGHIAYRKISNGLSVHTNHYIFPEIAYWMKETSLEGRIKSGTRFLIAQDYLVRMRNEKGKIDFRDTLALSRMRDNQKYPDMCPFRDSTVCAADYIASPENPGLLSTLLICPGPTRYAPAIPVPITIAKIPEILENGAFGKLAYQLKRAFTDKDDAEVIVKFNELEQRFLTEYWANFKEAKVCLDGGDKQKFLDTVQALLDKQVEEAFTLMQDVLKSVTPPPKAEQ
ncbi:MAG: hypothetical protein J6X55_17275 [Victivallales bacterium]|nr:hypothetical protein [Victivallales bacterium]